MLVRREPEGSGPDAPTARARPLWLLAPAGVYLGGQVLALWFTAVVANRHHRPIIDVLTSWDGAHFLAIADHGYSHTVTRGSERSPAFFPGYPAAIAALNRIVSNLTASALLISAVAGIVTAYGLVRLYPLATGRFGDRRAPLILVGLFATSPLSIVYAMAYSEALFCALAVWALIAILERHWMAAGALTCIAGTVRQTAIALCAALVVTALLDAHRGRGRALGFVAALLAPAGMLTYLVWVDEVTGRTGGWFKAERAGWDSHFDAGRATTTFAYHALIYAPTLLDVVTVIILGAGVAAGLALARSHIASAVVVYGAIVLGVDALSAGIMNSKVRLMLPAFVLLIPLATHLSRRWRDGGRWRLAVWAGAGIWYSAYALLMYGYAI